MKPFHEIIAWVTARAGHALMPDEGVQIGRADKPVRRIFVCWHADCDALTAAAEWKADFIVAHESLFAPYNANVRPELGDDWKTWPINRERLALLEKHAMGFCRLHYIADELVIYDDVAARLGLETPVVNEPDFVRIYETPPTEIGAWIARAKAAFGLVGLRVALPAGMDEATLVRRIGLPWGGMGLFVNVDYQQRLVARGCELFIAGETDNFAMRFAVEQGIAVIETSHDANEVPGFESFARQMQAAHADREIRFFKQSCVWQIR